VVEDHSPAAVAVAHACRPAVLLGEESLGVAQEQDFIALDAVDLAPGIHDPAVVGRNGRDNVDALLAELGAVLDVGRKVVGLASMVAASVVVVRGVHGQCRLPRSEGARDGEENDLLVGPFLAGIVFLRTTAGSWVIISNWRPPKLSQSDLCNVVLELGGGGVANVLELDALGQRITDFERCHDDQ
jgi:hypothetical protein